MAEIKKITGIALKLCALKNNLKKPEPILFMVVVISMSVFTYCNSDVKDWFASTDKYSLGIEILTLVTLVSLWLYNMSNRWIDSLPNYLTAKFYYDNQLRLQFNYIPLTDPADIRSQAQTIGQVLGTGRPLHMSISPYIQEICNKEICIYNGATKPEGHKMASPFEHHTVHINLQEDIKQQEDRLNLIADKLANLESHQYISLNAPFKAENAKIVDNP